MLPNHRCLLPKLFAVDRNAKRISHYLGLACSLYSCVSLCFIVVCSRTAIKTHFQQSRPIFSQSASTAIIEQMNTPTVRVYYSRGEETGLCPVYVSENSSVGNQLLDLHLDPF